MSFALLFAVLMILWAFFGFRPAISGQPTRYAWAGDLVLFILLLLLGWKVFGPLLHP